MHEIYPATDDRWHIVILVHQRDVEVAGPQQVRYSRRIDLGDFQRQPGI